jgi:GTPase SAR1 family protein
MAKTKCPYCWASHRHNELHMRCGERCDHKGETFVERQLKNGRCPHGQLPQSRRVCPNCERELLREYIDGGGRNIAVIGSSDSGKSTWVGVLVHEFQRGQVNERFTGMSLDLLGEASRLRYQRDFDTPLFEERRPLKQTASARVSSPEPLMFSLRFRRQRMLGTARVAPVVTVFYDTAGEDVARAEAMDELTSYLDAAEGIILLLDPLQMPKVRDLVGTNGTKTRYTDQLYVLNRLGELLRERVAGSVDRRLRTPLAIALTKLDLLPETLSPESPLRQPSRHVGVYDEADGLDVHEEVRAWLDQWYDPAFDRSIANTFETYRYFGLSALGAPPVDGNHLAPQGVHPYRLEDPMLWLLARFGAIKTMKGKR